jgi:hypothetical protein
VLYVVERYLPGVPPAELERDLSRLTRVTRELRRGGTKVRYLGSTIVPTDEACFCQFDAPSEAVVAEANECAAIAFDRIVPAVAVPGFGRRSCG